MFLRSACILLSTIEIVCASDVLRHIYFNRVHCKTNDDYCPHPICKVSFLSRKVKAFTWVCNLIKPVDLVNLRVILYYRYRNGFQKFLIDLNVDVCSYYDNILGSAVVDLVRKEVEKYSTNFIHGCPYTGNMTVINMPLTGALFDYIFLPAGDYKLVIDGKFDKQKLFGILVTAFFTVPAGRTLEDDNMG